MADPDPGVEAQATRFTPRDNAALVLLGTPRARARHSPMATDAHPLDTEMLRARQWQLPPQRQTTESSHRHNQAQQTI